MMKAAIMKDVVELEKVQSMIDDINEYFYRRGVLEGLGGLSHNSIGWDIFEDTKQEVVSIIDEHVKNMKDTNV